MSRTPGRSNQARMSCIGSSALAACKTIGQALLVIALAGLALSGQAMAAAPTVSPTIGEASYVVTVTGANLTVDNLQITNGASAVALPDQVDPTTFKFTATAPANSSQRTTHTVTGVQSDGVSYSFQITFDAAPLKLTSADVTTVDVDGGTMITVTGTGLTNTTWTWNDNPITVSVTGGVTASVPAPRARRNPPLSHPRP